MFISEVVSMCSFKIFCALLFIFPVLIPGSFCGARHFVANNNNNPDNQRWDQKQNENENDIPNELNKLVGFDGESVLTIKPSITMKPQISILPGLMSMAEVSFPFEIPLNPLNTQISRFFRFFWNTIYPGPGFQIAKKKRRGKRHILSSDSTAMDTNNTTSLNQSYESDDENFIVPLLYDAISYLFSHFGQEEKVDELASK